MALYRWMVDAKQDFRKINLATVCGRGNRVYDDYGGAYIC